VECHQQRRHTGWAFNNPGTRSNNTGGAGNFAIVDSDQIGNVSVNTELRTPP